MSSVNISWSLTESSFYRVSMHMQYLYIV